MPRRCLGWEGLARGATSCRLIALLAGVALFNGSLILLILSPLCSILDFGSVLSKEKRTLFLAEARPGDGADLCLCRMWTGGP